MKPIYCLILLLLVASGLPSACGQKGALFMPKPAPQQQHAEG